MNDDLEIMNLLDTVNTSIKELQSNQVSPNDVPGTFSMMFSGASNSGIMKFIFDTNLDKLLDQLFEMLMNGEFEEIINKSKNLGDVFNKFGLDTNKIFYSQVSKQFISTLQNTINSKKFQNMKNNIGKSLLLLKQLKQKAKVINDPVVRQKYKDAVYAFKQILKIAASIYKSRNNINARVKSGIMNFIREDINNNAKLYPIISFM